MYSTHWQIRIPPKPSRMLTVSSCRQFSRNPSSIRHCKMDSSIRLATLSQPLAALVRISACRASWRWVMGCSCISTPPMEMRSLSFRAQICTFLPFTQVPSLEPASEIVQLPSSYRVSTAWFRDTVGKSMVTSLDLLRPMTLSQWVMGIWVPSVIFSHAQISGSRRKVSRGMAQRSSKMALMIGTAKRRMPI